MDPWFAKGLVLASSIVMVVIRAPHGQRSREVKVVSSRKGTLEVVMLGFAWIGFLVPLIWIVSSVFAFADYPLRPVPYATGFVLLVVGLWVFYRSHADLGTNWSITLEMREDHQLITGGIYRRIRHPMYLGLLLYSIGQVLALPNWFAGPSYIATFGPLLLVRLGAEERMMLDAFGEEYEAYAARTKRIVPGIW